MAPLGWAGLVRPERRHYMKNAADHRRNEGATMDDQTRIELEAAAFRGLVKHLRKRTDAQNIDIMNVAGFCRNCLSKWYLAEAEARGIEMTDDDAREAIYGMPYSVWKMKHQKKATEEQMKRFDETKPLHANTKSRN